MVYYGMSTQTYSPELACGQAHGHFNILLDTQLRLLMARKWLVLYIEKPKDYA